MDHADELAWLRFVYRHIEAGPGALLDVERLFLNCCMDGDHACSGDRLRALHRHARAAHAYEITAKEARIVELEKELQSCIATRDHHATQLNEYCLELDRWRTWAGEAKEALDIIRNMLQGMNQSDSRPSTDHLPPPGYTYRDPDHEPLG